MTTQELLTQLRVEGLNDVTSWRLGHAVKSGRIPRPRLNTSLQFVWEAEGVSAARVYFQSTPKRQMRHRQTAEAAA